MPLKPREPTMETRAKDSKISPPRHVLAPGLHCVEFAHRCLLDENKHVLGVIFFFPADQPVFWRVTSLWMLICCSPVGHPLWDRLAEVPLMLQGRWTVWPLQIFIRPQLQFSIFWLLGMQLVLILPWLTCCVVDVSRQIHPILQTLTFYFLLNGRVWFTSQSTALGAKSADISVCLEQWLTTWPCPRCSSFIFPSVKMGLRILSNPPFQDCLLTCRAVIFPVYCSLDLLHELEWAVGCNDAKETLPQAEPHNIIPPWNTTSEEISNTRILMHCYIFSLLSA